MTTDALPIVDTVLWQIALAVLSAVAGAVASNYLLPGKRTSGKYTVTGNAFQGIEHVNIGDTTLTISEDNRVYITAAAVTAIAGPEPSKEAEPEEGRSERRRVARRRQDHEKRIKELEHIHRRGSSTESSDDWDQLLQVILFFVVVFIAIAGTVLVYAWYREPVTAAVRTGATVVLAFVLSGLMTAAVQKVKLDRKLRLQVAVNAIVAIAALLSLNWLTNPPSTVDRANFDRLLAVPRTFSVSDVVEGFDADVIFAVFYQCVGLILLTISLFLIACHTVMVFGIAGLAARTRADPGFKAGAVRRFIIRMFGGPARCWLLALVASAVSFLLIGGFAATYVADLQESMERLQVPSAPATPDPSSTS